MGLEFDTVQVKIEGDGGEEKEGHGTFTADVNKAEVAIQGFHLDFKGSGEATGMNHVSVTAKRGDISGRTVFFKVTTFYAGANQNQEYGAVIDVLVIADTKSTT